MVIGTAFGMGLLHLLTGQSATGESKVTASKQMKNEELKVCGTAEQTQAPKEEKSKAQVGTSLDPMEFFFVQEGMCSYEEEGTGVLEECEGSGSAGALKLRRDKDAVFVGVASDEQGIN